MNPKRSAEPIELRRLREQAKRLKKSQGIKLSHAYYLIALSYGFKSWVSLLTHYGWTDV